jgi:hypothetical protein
MKASWNRRLMAVDPDICGHRYPLRPLGTSLLWYGPGTCNRFVDLGDKG